MDNIEAIVAQAVSGDKTAQSQLFIISNQQVFYTCLGIVKNEADAKDIMQDVYMTALQKLGTLSDPNSFQAWINRIAVTRCMNFVKKRRTVSLDQELEENNREIVDEELELPDDYVSNKAKAQIVQIIINEKLSDVQRDTIIMHYFNNMKVEDIAEQMNCPVGTVKYRLSASRQIIKQEVLSYEEKSGDRIHALIPFPLGTFMLSQANGLTPPALEIFSTGATASSVAGSLASETGKTAVKKGIGVKIVAGVTAVAVASGTAVYAYKKTKPTAEKQASSTVQQQPQTYYDMLENEYEMSFDTTGHSSVIKNNTLYFYASGKIVKYNIDSGAFGTVEIEGLDAYSDVQFFKSYIYVLSFDGLTGKFIVDKYDLSGAKLGEQIIESGILIGKDYQSMRILSDGSLFIVDHDDFTDYHYINSDFTQSKDLTIPESMDVNYIDFGGNGINIFVEDDRLYVGETNNDGETESLIYDPEKDKWEEVSVTYYAQVCGKYVLKERTAKDDNGKNVTVYDLYDFETGKLVKENVGDMKDYNGGSSCYQIGGYVYVHSATISVGSYGKDFTEIGEECYSYKALAESYYLKTTEHLGSYAYYLCDGENEPIEIPIED